MENLLISKFNSVDLKKWDEWDKQNYINQILMLVKMRTLIHMNNFIYNIQILLKLMFLKIQHIHEIFYKIPFFN